MIPLRTGHETTTAPQGEQFLDEELAPALTRAMRNNDVVLLDLDGSQYQLPWLDAVFGQRGIMGRWDLGTIGRHLKIHSVSDPNLQSTITWIMTNALKRHEMVRAPSAAPALPASQGQGFGAITTWLGEITNYVIPGKKVGDVESPPMHIDPEYMKPKVEEVTFDGQGRPTSIKVRPSTWPPSGEAF